MRPAEPTRERCPMILQHRPARSTASALVLGVAIALAAPGRAGAEEQKTPPPNPPPSWAQGRLDDQAKSPLAPHVPALTAKPAKDLPLDKVKLPKGFKIEVWADGLVNARSITVGKKGTVFVGTRLIDRVYAVVDKGGRREVKVVAKGLHRPNGVVFRDGSLYVA